MPFSPTDLTGLTLWLKADAITGLVNGDPVSSWPDSSGGGNNATQGTTAAKPTYRTNVANSKPGVQFDGVDDYLSSAAVMGKPVSVFVAVKRAALGAIHTLVTNSVSPNGFQYRVEGTNNRQEILKQAAAVIATGSFATTTAVEILGVTYDSSGNYTFTRVNNLADGSGTNNLAITSASIILGRHPTGAEYLNGHLFEVVVYNSALSPTDRASVITYLSGRWGNSITPSSASVRGKSITLFTSSTAGTWTTTAGSLFTDAAATIPYVPGTSRTTIYLKAQNKTSTGLVSVNIGTTLNAAVSITGVFPAVPHYPHEWKSGKRGVVTQTARDGTTYSKTLGTGNQYRDFKLSFKNRKPSEYLEVEQFYNDHHPGLTFVYSDLWLNVEGTYKFDSEIEAKGNGLQSGEFNLALFHII